MHVPLWNKSNFSFLEGASHPEELVEQAHIFGLRAVAVTDRNSVSGVVRALVKAEELGIHLIVGAEVTVEDEGDPATKGAALSDGSGSSPLVLLAEDRRGYASLCRLLTRGRLRHMKGRCSVTWREVCEHATGLLALWGGDRSRLTGEAEPGPEADWLREAFADRLYAMAARHRRAEEVVQQERLRARARKLRLSVAAATEVLYHSPVRRDLQDVLTSIRHGVPLAAAGRLLKPNAEHAMKAVRPFETLFADEPGWIERTGEIAGRCSFSLRQIRYRYPSEQLPDGTSSSEWLRRLTLDGARQRFGGEVSPRIAAQIDRELALIDELDYCGYFLTMWELVRFCREQDILCQGRGSAANSVVCFCLGITAVDPRRVELLFERFLSRERAEPPDIDLDISHRRREEVIQHVYTRYGRDRAAMVANVIRYRARSAIREVGKALGLPATSLDRLAKFSYHHDRIDGKSLRYAGLDQRSDLCDHLLRLTNEIQDFPRHLSIHPGGFLLGHEPVHDLVPIENGAMEGRTVIQWDKDDLENLGLFKVDLLGLGALTQLSEGFELLEQHHGKRTCMATIPGDDRTTFDAICRGDTVGVFQIESRAQMAMLPRLRPRHYYDLVIEVSIVRPGPITGGMVHPYLRRRNGEEEVTYPHPSLEPVLSKTLGVPLFQEQVMRLAVVAADYTPGEADQLRRDMAAWRQSGRLDRHRERLVSRMISKGITAEFADRVFEQIRGFSDYGFPESHAASFALIAYATAWMKCHYPDVFTCSLLNAQPMGFYSPATIVEDARRHGVETLPTDVTRSQWHCTLEPAAAPRRFAVRMGLRYVRSLSESKHWKPLEQARLERPFDSLKDLMRRSGLDAGALHSLAEAGALGPLKPERRSALWEVSGLATASQETLDLDRSGEEQPRFAPLESFESIAWDYNATGLSSQGHPLEPFRDRLSAMKLPSASQVSAMPDGTRVRYAGIVICRQRPGTAGGVTFMTLEDETGFVNLVLWQRVFDRYQILAKTASFLGTTGTLQVEQGVTHLIVRDLWPPRLAAKPKTGGSRDFH